MDDLVRVLVFF